ncbi:MAG TPA: CRISPR-associated protein Cas4 [Saprospiraceae bacterium]|nr:CRISPR-associated protein Cas4 [Saprospiraceae bacterium]
MIITATQINYYHLCHRKLWLHANEIRMEHTSDTVREGKLIGENSYKDRSSRYTELELDGIKIDYYDAKNKIIHEIKKSDKMEKAHGAQVKYYLYKLWHLGIKDASGILEYPKLRATTSVLLEESDFEIIPKWENEIKTIISADEIPPVLGKAICRKCSYFEFCYA